MWRRDYLCIDSLIFSISSAGSEPTSTKQNGPATQHSPNRCRPSCIPSPYRPWNSEKRSTPLEKDNHNTGCPPIRATATRLRSN